MQRSHIEKCFDRFLDALSVNDNDRLDAVIEDLNAHYSGKSPAELYNDMLHAHAVLCGGTKEQIDKDVQKLAGSRDTEDKLAYIVGEMREAFTTRVGVDDDAIEKIFNIIGTHEENYNNIWEALFTAAAKRREQIENQFTARIDSYLERLDTYYKTGGKSLGAVLYDEAMDIAENETMEHHYEFILRHTSFVRGIRKEIFDHAFAVVSGSNELEKKYDLLTSICFETDYYEKLADLMVKAAKIVTHRNMMEMIPSSKTLN